jgi:fatty acid synthase subunit alpha
MESEVYLDPTMRAEFDGESWSFGEFKQPAKTRHWRTPDPAAAGGGGGGGKAERRLRAPMKDSKLALETTMQSVAQGLMGAGDHGVGVDIEPVETFAGFKTKSEFIDRNFSEAEKAYCLAAADPASSFAGRWAVGEYA